MKMLIGTTLAALILATDPGGCGPMEGSQPVSGPPAGATVYKVKVRSYEMTGPGEFRETSRRVYAEIDAIDTQGGHGMWWKLEEGARDRWITGAYPYYNPEQTPWDHPIYVGGEVPIISGTVTIILRDVNVGDKLECIVERNGLEKRGDRKSVIASQRGNLTVRCII
jgi:hypothetical protein